MSDCTNNCGSCSADCKDRTAPESFLEESNSLSQVKKVIGIVSGKGGVGKSMVTSLLAVLMNRRNYVTAILDADITGPSIPKAFGLQEKALGTEAGILTVDTDSGIRTMSINSLLEEDSDPVVWRGPIIAGTVKQFWSDVIWGDDVDFMFIDMPPGTGDVPLTVFQSLPVDGIVIVTSPQELVSMIVGKAVKMAQLMNIPILGIVENMSYFVCPDCGQSHAIFGESRIQQVAEEYGIDQVARLPIQPQLASAVDRGAIESVEGPWLDELADLLEGLLNAKVAVPYEDGQIFQHFGHAKQFQLFDIQRGEIKSSELITADCGGHGALAEFLAHQGVRTVLCGGIGDGAIQALAGSGITVAAGVAGPSQEQVELYLKGALTVSNQPTCDRHNQKEHQSAQGEHQCGHEHATGGSCGGQGSCGGSCH
ncbi:P-loop NTPase [Aminipila butyrica]|uniref:Iron-sulfur cluster carrier protein n=1 Tax=Aminipila butyrica TaxID=433296 RepID=A0A858BSG1_9FIRM|nr:P-loop NTPase [Aminipila butyrica]QIB68517.1 P-loop NTPase [Aminipila butyrica]